jgi:hypothetical protein
MSGINETRISYELQGHVTNKSYDNTQYNDQSLEIRLDRIQTVARLDEKRILRILRRNVNKFQHYIIQVKPIL